MAVFINVSGQTVEVEYGLPGPVTVVALGVLTVPDSVGPNYAIDLAHWASIPNGTTVAPTWLIGTTFGAGAGAIGSDTVLYQSVQAGNVGHDPTLDSGHVWWRPAPPTGVVTPPAPVTPSLSFITTASLPSALTALGVPGSGAYVTLLQPSGDTTGAADTAAVQAALNRASSAPGAHVKLAAGAWWFSGAPTLCIYSNTWLDCDTGATLNLISSTSGQLLRNRASGVLGDGSSFGITDCSVTAGGSTITTTGTTTGAHVQSFAGSKPVVVHDASGAIVLTTTGTYTDGTHLALAAAVTVAITAGGYVEVGPRDSNIKITGGAYVRTSGATSSVTGNGIMLFRVDKLRGGDIDLNSTGGLYMFQIGDVTDVELGPFRCATSRDGPHLNGPADNVRITGVSGSCGDDVIPIIPTEGLATTISVGSVTNVIFKDVKATTATSVATLWAGLVQGVLQAGEGPVVDNITYNNCRPSAGSNLFNCLMGGAYAISAGNIKFQGCYGQISIAGNGETGTVDRIIVEDHSFPVHMGTSQPVIKIKSSVTLNTLNVLRMRGSTLDTGNDCIRFDDSSHGGLVTVDSCDITAADIVTVGTSTASIGTVKVARSKWTSGPSAFGVGIVTTSGGAIGKTFIDGCEANGYAALALPSGIAYINGLDASACTNDGIVTSTGAALSIRGAGYLGPAMVLNGTANTVYGWDINADVSTLAKTAGQFCTNSNAGLSCGAGLVMANGTVWKNLITGATY